jgi:protein tyrosine phosphatase (PTP) superfamily phosphohydrolase (DUF442 family)
MKIELTGAILLSFTTLLLCGANHQTLPHRANVQHESAGLHNVHRFTDKLVSGSSPEGDAGFESLRKLGVKTIISVDGAQPDLERARRFGMRYVHVPIGYDGVTLESALTMARATRDLPGPVYIHCHHGQHRGPAGAAAIQLLLDPACSVDTVVKQMKRAGTDPKYAGLFASQTKIRQAGPVDLDKVSAEFPEAQKPAGFTKAMVEVDEQWDKLKLIKAAGWKTPKSNPDLSPAHEALMLVELFREAARLPSTQSRPMDFRNCLSEAEQKASKLEKLLTSKPTVDSVEALKAFNAIAATCTRCHAKYRDVPGK